MFYLIIIVRAAIFLGIFQYFDIKVTENADIRRVY